MSSWLIGQAGFDALRAKNPQIATHYFNNPSAFIIGWVPSAWKAQSIREYTSFKDYVTDKREPAPLVMYVPEAWTGITPPPTPLIEQQHPAAMIRTFAAAAHDKGQKLLVAPARDLMTITGADYSIATKSEIVKDAFLSSGLPGDCGTADVYICQAQADQDNTAEYTAFINAARSQLPPGFPVWAGLTTMRGDSVGAMVACWRATHDIVQGYWLNTTKTTIEVAAEFLDAVNP
jgi:hypothetical protein